jgi:hypothetical protein
VVGVFPPQNEWGPEPELGYMLASAFHGHGLATEAVRAVLADAFGRLRLERIVAIVDVPNVGSIRVLEKADFDLDREYLGDVDGEPEAARTQPRVQPVEHDAGLHGDHPLPGIERHDPVEMLAVVDHQCGADGLAALRTAGTARQKRDARLRTQCHRRQDVVVARRHQYAFVPIRR